MLKKAKKGDHCLNCKQELSGENFCPNCGQKNDSRRLTFWDMLTESFTNLFALDSKIFNSLKPLFTKPGKLTEEYVKGKRTKFIHPVRLYLGASILLFTVFSLTNKAPDVVHYNETPETNEELVELVPSVDTNNVSNKILLFINKGYNLGIDEGLDSIGVPKTMGNKMTYLLLAKAYNFNDKEEQNKFSEYFRSKLPIAIFIFLPLFALALRLVYVQRDYYYLDHLIFTFHNVALLFLLWTVVLLIGLSGSNAQDFATNIMFLVFLVYTVIATKNFYKQGWGKTILKYIIINLMGLVMSIFFLVLTLVIVLTLY